MRILAARKLREKLCGLNVMESVLDLDKTPPALERSFNAATRLRHDQWARLWPIDIEIESIPLMELSS